MGRSEVRSGMFSDVRVRAPKVPRLSGPPQPPPPRGRGWPRQGPGEGAEAGAASALHPRSHALRGNALSDAPRPVFFKSTGRRTAKRALPRRAWERAFPVARGQFNVKNVICVSAGAKPNHSEAFVARGQFNVKNVICVSAGAKPNHSEAFVDETHCTKSLEILKNGYDELIRNGDFWGARKEPNALRAWTA